MVENSLSLRYLELAKKVLDRAVEIEECRYCKDHIKQARSKVVECIVSARLGLRWDAGEEPKVVVLIDMMRTFRNLILAYLRRLARR